MPADGAGVSAETGWQGGFDCVLGNPPWDSVELKEQEFFAQRSPAIAAVGKADSRKKLIAALEKDPDTLPLYREYADAKRAVYAESHFLRRSGRVPLTGQGNLNTYAVFSETARIVTGPQGRSGVIVPTGIATDARTQYFFKDLVEKGSIAALYDFENRDGLFPAVDSRMKFSILSMTGNALLESAAQFAFFLRDPAELADGTNAFTLTPEEIKLLNPNTGTCPIFRSRRDAEITLGIYRRLPVLIKEPDESGSRGSNLWEMSFMRMFDISHDSRLFHTREELEANGWVLSGNTFTKSGAQMLPLYEGKMISFFNHRAADVIRSETAVSRPNQPRYLDTRDLRAPNRFAFPLFWVAESELVAGRKNGKDISTLVGVSPRLKGASWKRGWLCGWCDVTSATNERTAIPSFLPRAAVGNTYFLMLPNVSPSLCSALIAAQSSLAFDFVSRQKISSVHLQYFIWKQLPVPAPQTLEPHTPFLTPRVLELVYTAYDMTPLARDLGDTGAPFRWEDDRRAQIRAELDAYFFYLYGITRDEVEYILETFQSPTGGLKNNEIAKYGTYRTRDLVLAEYDRMTPAGPELDKPLTDGANYTSTLTPPPGHGPRHPAEPKDA